MGLDKTWTNKLAAGFVERIAKGDVLVGADAAKRLVGRLQDCARIRI